MAESDTVYGLDTSVVLRLLVAEPPDQALVARQFVEDSFREGIKLVVSDLVAAESYFALQHYYRVPKREALHVLLELLEGNLVSAEEKGVSVAAIRTTLSSSKKVGFVDRMIHERYRQNFASMVTFERTSARLPQVKVLKT